jgi:uncharacterized membrane protein
LYNIISNGTSHGMEKFAVMLNEAQMWSLVGTARSLSLQSPATAANRSQIKTGEDSGSDSELSQGEDVFLIEGKVTNGSGGELDELGEVKLVIASDGQTLQELTAPLTQNGAFDFIAVPYSSDWNYTAQIEENGVVYKSVRLSGKSIAASDTVSLKIKMYDVASDLAVLRGERLHVLLDFKDESTIHVTESLLISNPSSYTISPANAQSALLQFTLNSDAQGIKFDDFSGEEYLKVSNGVVGDWQPILPGSVHQVMFEYDLPFKGEKTIEFNAPVQIISAMVVVENGTKNIACTGMHLSNQNMTLSEPVLLFTGVNIEAGGKLALHCYDKKNFFPVVIGISALGFAVLVVILIAVEVKRKGKNINRAAGKGVKRNNLLDAVIALDDQFKAGEISAETYRDKREELIKKLEGE